MILVGTATGKVQKSTTECTLEFPKPPPAASKGHILPTFTDSLVGVGMLCDTNCTVVFNNSSFTVLDPQENFILTRWRKRTGPKLWRFSLCPQHQPVVPTGAATDSLKDFSAQDLPSVESLVCYLHAAAGSPVRSTWIATIKANKYSSCPGLTYQNASKYCPASTETPCSHMKKNRQVLHSTTCP